MTPVVQHQASDALDDDYRFGRRQVYLTPHDIARVLTAALKAR